MCSDSLQFAGRDEEDRQCKYKRNIPVHSCDHCCNGRAVSIVHYECVFVTLGINMQCACAIMSSVASPTPQYFSILSHKWQDIMKKLLNIKRVSIFSTTFV